jgi:hypothetical protein
MVSGVDEGGSQEQEEKWPPLWSVDNGIAAARAIKSQSRYCQCHTLPSLLILHHHLYATCTHRQSSSSPPSRQPLTGPIYPLPRLLLPTRPPLTSERLNGQWHLQLGAKHPRLNTFRLSRHVNPRLWTFHCLTLTSSIILSHFPIYSAAILFLHRSLSTYPYPHPVLQSFLPVHNSPRCVLKVNLGTSNYRALSPPQRLADLWHGILSDADAALWDRAQWREQSLSSSWWMKWWVHTH